MYKYDIMTFLMTTVTSRDRNITGGGARLNDIGSVQCRVTGGLRWLQT